MGRVPGMGVVVTAWVWYRAVLAWLWYRALVPGCAGLAVVPAGCSAVYARQWYRHWLSLRGYVVSATHPSDDTQWAILSRLMV